MGKSRKPHAVGTTFYAPFAGGSGLYTILRVLDDGGAYVCKSPFDSERAFSHAEIQRALVRDAKRAFVSVADTMRKDSVFGRMAREVVVGLDVDRVCTDVNRLALAHQAQDSESCEDAFNSLRKSVSALLVDLVAAVLAKGAT